MAEKKYGTSKGEAYQNKNKKQAAKSAPSVKSKKGSAQKTAAQAQGIPSFRQQVVMILLAVVAVFIAICFIFPSKVGLLGYGLASGFFGVFGLAAFLVPILMMLVAYFWRKDVLTGAVRYRYLFAIGVLVLSGMILHIFRGLALHESYTFATAFTWENLKGLFVDGMEYQGGGFLGGIAALALICSFGYPGALIFGFLFLIVLLMALFGLTPTECAQRYMIFYRNRQAKKAIRKKEKEAQRAAEQAKARERYKLMLEKAKAAEAAKAAATAAAAEAEETAVCDDVNEDDDMDDDDADLDEDFDDDLGVDTDADEADAAESNLRKAGLAYETSDKNYKKISIGVTEGEELFREDKKQGAAVTAAEEDEAEASENGEEEQSGDFFDEAAQGDVTVTADEAAKKALAWDPDDRTAEMPVVSCASDGEMDEDEAVGDEFEETEDFEESDEIDEIEILPPDPMVEAPSAFDEEAPEEIPSPPEYQFPPLDLLQPPEEISRDESVSQELRENADRIIETLDNFHVRVSISHVSRGPTVTRYELEPAAGTRVRSITNLLDDIALSLATSGVRSDGIIAGKSAIGIEVPNKTVNTVYVRELIEDARFTDAKSRLTTCLGMDVSGAPVYLDIAKMPHLLIAGATGMGKSVCINSLLVSLLYKARPDEVKLILIDPKKVELNIYNGIPHLLVPVVFDPKKAAGSLHWAVTEMERRFELIESKNTRNIAQYNAAIADDPTQEFLPQIVIVIDELADLMMSAPDDVEASICRLAQKARAAGMHLIIGTQRPSVDVITGLIKANIPSRIAFTVASQIDSRTIIDSQGAEKLIGRGDMLYAPVGASKPIRVQGSFVSETEIEEVVDYIRSQGFGDTYSDDVMAQINRAAELCGQKKGKGAAAAVSPVSEGSADDNDPMLDSAIELAVESGKISTSLIQRRLQLGYGRAAKIIDMMERRGIVSAPDGQKPRAVLITREQYLEMQMNRSNKAQSGMSDESL